jgi:hypothetical protein
MTRKTIIIDDNVPIDDSKGRQGWLIVEHLDILTMRIQLTNRVRPICPISLTRLKNNIVFSEGEDRVVITPILMEQHES